MSHAHLGGGALMNPQSLESNYVSFAKRLETKVFEMATQWPAMSGFWQRWCAAHKNIARSLSSDDFGSLQRTENAPVWSEFLRLRQRQISALEQGLKNSKCSAENRHTLKLLLAEHDKGFIDLLQMELERVREQMTQAFAVRKTVSAYAQTAQYRRE